MGEKPLAIFVKELQRDLLGLAFVVRTQFHALDEAGRAMVALVPVIHAGHGLGGLVNGQHGAFRDDLQVGIGNDGGDFDDAVGLGDQSGHLQVDPDEVLLFIHGMPLSASYILPRL